MKNNEFGQALFEVVVALGVAVLIIVAIISATVFSVKNADSSRNITKASRFSQELTEYLRYSRDQDWILFKNKASTSPGTIWCFNTNPPVFPGTSSANVDSCKGADKFITGTTYNRFVTLTILDAGAQNTIQADVVTYWTDQTGSHQAASSTKFTNWLVAPACLGHTSPCVSGGVPCCSPPYTCKAAGGGFKCLP